MEDLSKTESPSMSEAPLTRHRISLPDVPEDVEDEIVPHFNDPNWDYRANSSTMSISTDGVEYPPTYISTDMDAPTEFDTGSHLSSVHKRGSKADVSYRVIQVQSVFLLCCPYCNFSFFVLYQRFTVPRSPGSRREHR